MDASCGPSNGVKTLQRHFETDRSLHQTQVRQSGNNGAFRTTPEQAGLLRAQQEQEQFLNAGRAAAAASPLSFREHETSSGVQGQGWAHDFQHAAPRIAQVNHALSGARQQNAQPPSSVVHGGWGAEFMAMQTGPTYRDPATMMMNGPQPIFQQQQQPQGPYMAYTPAFTHAGAQQVGQARDVAAVAIAEVQGQDAAFHQAFSEAEASLQNVRLSSPRATGLQEGPTDEEEATELTALDDRQESMEQLGDRLEADALADTAGELLHAMRDEQSAKFQRSSFMRLMHKLRDREVVVERGKMVDAATHTEIKSHQAGLPADAAGQQQQLDHDGSSLTSGQHYHGTDLGDRP